MKKITTLLLSAMMLAPLALSANAATYELPTSSDAAVGESIINIKELNQGNWDSRRESMVAPSGWTYSEVETYLCTNDQIIAGEAPCEFKKSGNSFYGSNLLPVCLDVVQENCIEAIAIELSDSAKVTGILSGYAGGSSFSAIPELGIYEGSTMPLFRVPGVLNSEGTDTYAVSIRSRQDYDHFKKQFTTVSINLAVVPYKEVLGDYRPAESFQGVDANGKNKVYGGIDPGCVWADFGKCGVLADFVGDPKISLTFRGVNNLAGWFRGRISAPEISVESFSTTNNRYLLSGNPVSVPRFSAVANSANTPAAVKALFPVGSGGSGRELFEGESEKGAFSTNREAFTILEGMRPAVGDSAAGTSTLWNLESIGLGDHPCFAKSSGFIGVVTTNATVYEGGVPGFEDGQLTYKVAGLHYAPDGTSLNLGTYDLVMRSDVARCLYGFSKAPISAKVSVLNNKGQDVVATTVVRESDGWINLAAYGFTFSEKKITARITQPQNKTLTKFVGSSIALSSKQKAEVKSVVAKAKGNPKFICTGIYLKASDKTAAIKRARAACNYAKSLNPDFSFWSQAKVTKASSYAGKVLITSK